MYRLPTALAPYASHPELTQFHSQIEECASELAEVGALARERDVRLSTHPGQYTVLNSERVEVRAAAVAELESQAALLDAMGLGEEAVVVLHVGSATGGVAASLDRFLAGFELLFDAARARLGIENDDRSFGLADVLVLAERAGLRVVDVMLEAKAKDLALLRLRDQLGERGLAFERGRVRVPRPSPGKGHGLHARRSPGRGGSRA